MLDQHTATNCVIRSSIERIWTRFAKGSLFIAPIYELIYLASSIFIGFTKHYGDAISIAVGLLPSLMLAHVKPPHRPRWAAFFILPVPRAGATLLAIDCLLIGIKPMEEWIALLLRSVNDCLPIRIVCADRI